MSHTADEERTVAKQTEKELAEEAHWAEMDTLRIALHRSIEDSILSIGEAHDALAQLDSGGDVEYEGGSEFKRHLNEVQRLLTITKALMPTDAEGGTNTDPQLAATVRALMSGTHLK
jgi:hypothetical protein